MTSNIVYSILGFVFAIGLLTTVHEYGHFCMARCLGVKVLRFSIGFGKSLLAWHDKHGTEYVIAALPLGGYVKMLDQNEGIVASNELHRAFNNKPIWARMLIIAAGPAFNLLFAILAYAVVFMWGVTSIVPVLGDVPKNSIAYTAGLRSNAEIIAIDEHATATWEDIAVALVSHIGDNDLVNIKVRNIKNNVVSDHVLNLNNWTIADGDENILKNLGFEPLDPTEPIVGAVMPNMPAAKSGLKPGDHFVSIDGVAITSRSQVLEALRSKYDHTVQIVIQRNNEPITFLITPNKKILEGGEPIGFIGIEFQNQPWPETLIRVQRYSPMVAVPMAIQRTKDYSVLTLQFIGKMVTGKMSLDHVAGPISIAKFAGRTARSGLEYFLSFLALVSISLGVLNMLPIPILDGGHFLFCTIELIRGKALSQRSIQLAYNIGFILLGSFMLLAIYNDLNKIAM